MSKEDDDDTRCANGQGSAGWEEMSAPHFRLIIPLTKAVQVLDPIKYDVNCWCLDLQKLNWIWCKGQKRIACKSRDVTYRGH